MKLSQVLVLTVLVSAATSVLTLKILSRAPAGTEAASQVGLEERRADLDELRRGLAELRDAVERLESAPRMAAPDVAERAPVAERPRSLTDEELEALAARLAERQAALQPEPPAPNEVAAALQRLLDPSLSEAERLALWAEMHDEGLLDALVAEYEKRVATSPQDSTAHTNLGLAYHQKMRFSGGGPEAGRWGQKGSEAYAKALELDETNWEARFAQAQHFYYAGMQGEARLHLETLREQQGNRRPEERHAEAYLLLGSMVLEQGDAAEARKIWLEGLALFPDNERLRALAQ